MLLRRGARWGFFFDRMISAVSNLDSVLHLLRKYLGEYVHGLSAEALRISVWKGDVVLKDLKLKAEALNSLQLPVTVKAGFVGTITLKVPWKSLGKEPVIVLIDRVFVLAHPAPDGRTLNVRMPFVLVEEDRKRLFEAKLQEIEGYALLCMNTGASSWLGSLIATIIGNLKISISNVHIRYEDSVSNLGHPFSSGITLAKLAAVTMDERGNETFDTSGALDKLRKSLQLERLALYHDSNSPPWKIEKNWEDLNPKEWIEIFEAGISESANVHERAISWASNRKYLVSPINGVLKYHRLGKQERNDPDIPLEKASIVLTDVSLTISEAQYHDCLKLLEVVSRYKAHVSVAHLRPMLPVSKDRRAWWQYGIQASLQQKRMCYHFSWDRIRYLCQLRRCYIQLYANSLQQSANFEKAEIRKIEKDLDSKVILLWRLLAHAKVESVKSKEAALQRNNSRSWFSFTWGTSGISSEENDSVGSESLEDKLTKEEWQTINKLLSYQPDEDVNFHLGKGSQHLMQFLVNISISQAAARIISSNQIEILCGRFEQLDVTTKFYQRSTQCDVSLKFCGLSAPEGSLAESVCSEGKMNALVASVVHSPVWIESYNRFLEFIKRSNAVSPTVALETATALQHQGYNSELIEQMKIEKVTRRAQEQFQMVLEEKSRFALDIDFDAPKVRVPLRSISDSNCRGHLLLDFGHFTVHTEDSQRNEQRQSIYSRFYITGRDIAAVFMNCGSDNGNCTLTTSALDDQSSRLSVLEDADHFFSLIDRCGMAVIVDQIKIPHPSYPSTRISIQVPNLGIHFSPARYFKIMELLNLLYGMVDTSDQNASEDFQTGLAVWGPANLSADARILVWRGIGNSVAEWQPCHLVLSGLYLYVLESETSQTYQRCASMAGRQVYEVPPTSVGGSQCCIAVCSRGMALQKALESSSTFVIEVQDEGEKAKWMKGLMQATYRASAPPSIDVFAASTEETAKLAEPRSRNDETANLVITGTLVELSLFLYGKNGDGRSEKLEEMLILMVLANGAKVNLLSLGGDLSVKLKLHSLKIRDELQGHGSMSPQYLVCSVLKYDELVCFSKQIDKGKEHNKLSQDDDDIFKDALPEFFDLSSFSQDIDKLYGPKLDSWDSSNHGAAADSAISMMHDEDLTIVRVAPGEIYYEAQENDVSDFVSLTFSTKNPGSPSYDGIDTQMRLRMSKLDFFCNRPTLVALVQFGLDLNSTHPGTGVESEIHASNVESSPKRSEENGRAFVKGLLGYGKGRVVFRLYMDVDSVSVFLNKEDGSQLAMLVQERFLLDLRVHPSSLSIEGTLGNFRLCDMSLGMDHCWGWLCDIRNPGTESLIKFTFNSYNAEDDDFEGYDYSLCGRLSGVRIVFLYRFVQEMTMYFMELATPTTEEAIKLVDKVGGFEWLIRKDEIDGATALKLDLSLDTPIIVVPRSSSSKDFMQLDLSQLHVWNEFSWHGSTEKDPSAVHLDILHAEEKIFGINMAVGINGLLGKPMMREAQGINIYVGLLHALVSDKEYNVILDCALMNLAEEPKLPPSIRGNVSASKDTMRMIADKVNLNSQYFLSRTVTITTVEVNYALLELCNGTEEDSPLAHLALEGLWVSYRMTSLSEADLYLTIPVFSVYDIRPDTRPEMRLMLGSSSHVPKQGSSGIFPIYVSDGNSAEDNLQTAPDLDSPSSTMLLMDYRFRSSSQSFVVRIQQPRILVVPDFLLALGEFFVPALGAITGREETLDPKNDPLTKNESIVLSLPVYKQEDDVIYLSPKRQLIVDALGVDEYTYDGCGRTIHLSEEVDLDDSSPRRPVIVVGCGKKLRFMNVRIENGGLLKKCTYLSNESSYSVSVEDDVNISLLENSSVDNDKQKPDYLPKSSVASSTTLSDADGDANQMQSVTFEAQVVSPELTFYDSTKSSMDDSLLGEKFLRAKMDLSFMYASKENDTWIRALVKDLTFEAGSGFIILDPVDISGGYTSLKDKTNISLMSTDVCLRLSLSVLSLILNLESQATAALQLGNACPLATCNGSGYNLTFWRPRAPSNYAILGDCVTSRPIPPSQVVLAVSNRYGRVRKPLGFKLIGSFSSVQGLEGDEKLSEGDCSLWMPVPPPGYLTLGCVAHPGDQPPPTHVVYCIRADLATSSAFKECMFSIPPNPRFSSGFSIWRVDNAVGSFYAQAETEYPSKDRSLDFSHILLCDAYPHRSSFRTSMSNISVDHDYGSQQGNHQNSTSSGWDVVRSISGANGCYISTPHFERIWWDKGGDLRRPVSIWRPVARPGYGILGDCITEGLEPPALGIIFKCNSPEVSAKPVQFAKVSRIERKGLDDAFFWYPIAPPGYASLGCIVSKTDEAPKMDYFCCPRMDLVNPANILELPISRSSSSKGSHCWSIWKVENQASTFLARTDLKKPSSRLAYSICDSVKPKTRENISAEMKLRFFSLTVLNSFYGTMTPLFDTTIKNINLVTHGRPESMNAVLISSIAASTFNTQLEAWEPLVEPFDGIFKFETYDTNASLPERIGKRIRIAATSILNLNLTAASLETFIETVTSWRKHMRIEKKTLEAGGHIGKGDDSSFSALDEDDLQTVIIQNKLGCDIFLKKADSHLDSIQLLPDEQCASVVLPPRRFSDTLNVVAESRETRRYVAVQIYEAKGLPILDDGNGHSFFCALRLVVDSHATDQQKLFPQSARTKCVKPLISDMNDLEEGTAKWNELFIFEVPREGIAKLEVEVTNLAAKAGKGEVVGAFSISIGQGACTLKKVASVRQSHATLGFHNISSYPLRKRGKVNTDMEVRDHGFLLISTSHFERITMEKFQKGMDGGRDMSRDDGFYIGFDPEGPWDGFRSLLPISVVPKMLKENFVAMEVTMKNGKKHAIFRSLAIVANDSDVIFDLCLCPVSTPPTHMYLGSERNLHDVAVEEIFENQRCQPSSGWVNKWPSFRDNNPGRWSTRDFSYSSKDFFEPALPSGWRWTSTWTVDKSEFVDADGWAYGPDYLSLTWPPSSKASTKSSLDCVRRRRWIRKREQLVADNSMPDFVTLVNPGSSAVLPWRSMKNGSDLCLQVRPYAEYPNTPYSWGHTVLIGSEYTGGVDQSIIDQASLSRQNTFSSGEEASMSSFKLNKLEKKDSLMQCNPSPGEKHPFWLSIGTDASVLHTELNTPVYDWKISINSPLKLENRLPSSAEFTIWERSKDGRSVERQNGIISTCRSVNVYSADVRRPIYLTLFVHDSWVLEKDPILILDLSSLGHVSSFWMVHRKSNRRLRVSIERDMGRTNAAPKTIRFFVPYWISNDSSLPLTYRVVEVEQPESAETDSSALSRVVKPAKLAMKNANDKRNSGRKNFQILEDIEDSTSTPVMLSPQGYVGRGGILPFPSRSEAILSPRVGISVAIRNSEHYSSGVSLLDIENKERVDIRAFASDGSYYKLSVLINTTSDRTKHILLKVNILIVVHFQPQYVFINRVGCSIALQQCDTELEEWFSSSDPPKPFQWRSSGKVELLKFRLDGYSWSSPFSIGSEGVMSVSFKNHMGNERMYIRVEVRSGTKSSSYEVVFHRSSFSSPYRIENRSMFLPIHFRQVDGTCDSWKSLSPNAASSFLWEDLGRKHMLEVLVDGTDPIKAEKFNIDEVFDLQPIYVTAGGGKKALCVSVLKEDKKNVVKISDWMPENGHPAIMSGSGQLSSAVPSGHDPRPQNTPLPSDCEFHIIIELAELGISIVDHTPEEILYLSVQNLFLSRSTGLGSGISRPQKVGEQADYIIKFSLTIQSNGSLDLLIYPYIGFYVDPENSAFLVNIHEPIIWRLHEMIQKVNLSRLRDTETTAVSVDPIIQIGVLNISEIRFKVSMAMSPTQRPRGVLGFWSSLMTSLGNTENMTVKLNQRIHEGICMRHSALVSTGITNIRKDLLSQPLQLLSGVDILGNASSALGHMSKGVAALSMDKKFIQSRQRQESKAVEDIGDVIREGGGALAKGLFRGVTGILTKPLEGAKSSGVEGFVQGVGKGIIGAAAQPVSGVLDLLSKTTEGANAVRMKITSAITSEEQLLRRRLPRVISADNLLCPYDMYKAQGQVILQLAESGTFFGQVDLFKVRGKFALSDSYEDHFMLPKGKIAMVTHRRVILLQLPFNSMTQKKFSPVRDPCSVQWDVLWDDLMTMELADREKDNPKAPPSQLIIYMRTKPSESKELTRIIKCNKESQQAFEIYCSIDKAMSTYGPNRTKAVKKVTKPYSPNTNAASAEVLKEGIGNLNPQQMPGSVPLRHRWAVRGIMVLLAAQLFLIQNARWAMGVS
ncbi:hypothetical protein Sjap_007202 [Stephania japonica]|uniref:C2 domain-containing protein n=1 Tax=Stephania japonica TaxID=461633 RepID=A0AAP0JNU7_9MAGN